MLVGDGRNKQAATYCSLEPREARKVGSARVVAYLKVGTK